MIRVNRESARPVCAERFQLLWRDLKASGEAAPVRDDLLLRWSEPHRHYHASEHLAYCLAELDAHRPLAENAATLEAAIWFHDAVYDPRASDNEVRSASLARDVLSSAKVAQPWLEAIESMILATRAHESDGSPDMSLLLDIDLAILGASPGEYARYAEAIRREYAWVPDADYRAKRAAVLRRFLARPALFVTEAFHRMLETQARANLAEEITRLQPGLMD